MRKGTRLKLKRRREGLTYYRRRESTAPSGKPRLVVRSSNKYVYVYLTETVAGGDRILSSANSRELRQLGWEFGLGNTPAAYLTGALLAKRAASTGVNEAILDIGLATPTTGNKQFAAAKGCADLGLSVRCDESVIPNEDRIRGRHIAAFLSDITNAKTFSKIRAKNLGPESMIQQFEAVLSKIKGGGK